MKVQDAGTGAVQRQDFQARTGPVRVRTGNAAPARQRRELRSGDARDRGLACRRFPLLRIE